MAQLPPILIEWTWEGVNDGLRKKRPIYVRYPEKGEKNANLLLIQKGAAAVDMNGDILHLNAEEQKSSNQLQKEKMDADIIAILNNTEMISAKDIISRLHLDWKVDKMKRYLESLANVEKIKEKNRVYFSLKGKVQKLEFPDLL